MCAFGVGQVGGPCRHKPCSQQGELMASLLELRGGRTQRSLE